MTDGERSRDAPPTPGADPRGWRLHDGTQIHVRALRPDDRALEVEFLESLSQQTRYYRLMTPLRHLSADLLDRLMDVNDADRAALVATVVADGKERFIGVARYAGGDIAGEAELGITVADAWQRRGIASGLLERLIERARTRGIERLIGLVLPDNHRMLGLARKHGFSIHLDAASRLMAIEKNLVAPSAGCST
jgi:acetyltransferase